MASASSPPAGGVETFRRTLAVLGFRGVGKSSLLSSLLGRDFSEDYEPTVVATHRHTLTMKGGRVRFDLKIVDTAGQDEFSTIPTEASLGVHGYILVFDVTSRTSFEKLRHINDKLLEAIGADAVPRVVVANKSDLRPDSAQQVSDAEGRELAALIGCKLVETSARTSENVEHLFETILRQVEARTGLLDDDPAPAPKPGRICTVL
ncbi:hypothetical protein FNF31_05432 [Cafeteria roenbergensis]|uniref:Uncharacterized protein n=1 Tax=Cafeteria roenbergensis TaxID=33653 RepID=A0A5A8CYX3_CAFRO|nr:hypothetical protein FNF31_05432 [Cafeteria roenbergensis]